MRSKDLFLILSILSSIAAIYASCLNFVLFRFAGFGSPLDLPVGVMMLITYSCGLITVGAVWAGQKRRESKGEQKKLQWEKQDQKLAVEIASDEKKLLEAKIATLEAALKAALKKKEK